MNTNRPTYAPSMQPLLALPLSTACDDGCSGESQVEPIKEEKEKAAKLAAITETKAKCLWMAELYCETTSLLSEVDADLTSESLSVSSTGVMQSVSGHSSLWMAELYCETTSLLSEVDADLDPCILDPVANRARAKGCCNSVLGKSDPQTEPVVKQMFLIATARLKPDFEQQFPWRGAHVRNYVEIKFMECYSRAPISAEINSNGDDGSPKVSLASGENRQWVNEEQECNHVDINLFDDVNKYKKKDWWNFSRM
ncbi:hypothetical protein Tco_0667478 [Tanacetum coccineum]